MPDFSVITCISRPDVYESCFLESVYETRKKQDVEIIPIINNGNMYSASNALNVGLDAARSDILILAHQDVRLLPGWFDILVDALSGIDDEWGIIGTAGIGLQFGRADIGRWGGAIDGTVAVGTVYEHHDAPIPYWDGLKELTKVHCIDECLFVLNKRTGLRFDQQFDGFHFYGVDICLQARAAGYHVYASHLPIIHYGQYSASFTGDKKYWAYLRYLHNKWKLQFPEMLGTHMHWGQNSDDASDELTSYISLELEDDSGLSVGIKAMGISKARFSLDKQHHFVEYDNV